MVREQAARFWIWTRLDDYPVDGFTTSVHVMEEGAGWTISDLCVSRSPVVLPNEEPDGPPWLSNGIIWKGANEAGVTVAVLKQLRLSEIKAEILADLPESILGTTLRAETALEMLRASMGGGRSPLLKARLAAAYEALTKDGSRSGNKVHKDLADALEKSPLTVQAQVRDIRKEGYLTSAGAGRAGGAITDKARRILESAGDL